jgi:archaellum component FlaG (FlaF/FlaG flagellin family)
MGADTTSTHLIFFIAATVVATATAGILSGVVTDMVGKATQRGDAFGDEMVSNVKIINDPARVLNNPVALYVKNTGATTLDWYNATLIVDGQLVTSTKSLLGGEASFRPGAVMQMNYAATLSSGDHSAQVVMENGVKHELRFRI